MSDRKLPDVCVITHPLAAAGENATRSLLDILSAITSVSLVTADLPVESEIRNQHELIELTEKGAGDSVPLAAGRFLMNQLRMCRTLLSRDEEVVLFFGATAYVLPILFARLLNKTVIVEPRGDVPLTLRLTWEQKLPNVAARGLSALVSALEGIGFALANGVVTYTPSMAEQLGLNPQSPDVYGTGARYVRTDQFRVMEAYQNRDMIIGFIGRLDEEKGIRELSTVAQRLPEEITFRFVGDGPLREWLEDELTEEIAAGQVELTGWVDHDEVPAHLNELTLLVLPSRPTEGLPTTILEALACGTPVLASPVSGVPDVVKDGESGYFIDSREPDILANTITQILYEEDLASASSRGRKLIEAEYSFEAACNRYRDILLRLSSRPS